MKRVWNKVWAEPKLMLDAKMCDVHRPSILEAFTGINPSFVVMHRLRVFLEIQDHEGKI